jgi:hypothetical protein
LSQLAREFTMPASPYPPCPHLRKRLVAEDKDAQYWECLDCGKILESGELSEPESPEYNESLSDA